MNGIKGKYIKSTWKRHLKNTWSIQVAAKYVRVYNSTRGKIFYVLMIKDHSMQSHLDPVQLNTRRRILKNLPVYRLGQLKQTVVKSISFHFQQTEGKQLCETKETRCLKMCASRKYCFNFTLGIQLMAKFQCNFINNEK